MKTKVQKEALPVLSCNEARIVLKTIPPDKQFESIETLHQRAALKHYGGCQSECQCVGFSKILDVSLSCKEVLEEWARNDYTIDLWRSKTVREVLAVEHVVGRLLPSEIAVARFDQADRYYAGPMPIGKTWEGVGGCKEKTCVDFCNHLHSNRSHNVGLCSPHQENEDLNIPFLIELFVKKGWKINLLLESQLKRLAPLVEDHNHEDVVGISARKELRRNLELLHSLLKVNF